LLTLKILTTPYLKGSIDKAGVLLHDARLSLQQAEEGVLRVEQHLALLLILKKKKFNLKYYLNLQLVQRSFSSMENIYYHF
jgi:hypothetical protein